MPNGSYNVMEPKPIQQLGSAFPGSAPLGFNASAPVNLFTTTSFLYTAGIMLIIVVAAGRYMLAGVWRIQASEAAVTKSNKEIRRVTLGLLGVLSLFVILYTFNKGLLKGDVGLDGLRSGRALRGSGGLGTVVPTTNQSTSGTARACELVDDVKAKLASGNICGGATCSRLAACKYQQYLPIIRTEAAQQGVDPRLVVAILCQENQAGNATANRTNTDIAGKVTYDCGLMQVNQPTECGPDSYDLTTNIKAGVRLIKNASNQIYQGIPPSASIAASYNAGPGYNQSSRDCTQEAGFLVTLPKWACPINPGNTTFNMCSVKAYSCEVTACIEQLGPNF